MAAVTQQPALLGLPVELLHHILSFLDPLDLPNVAQTSRALVTPSYDNKIWRQHVNRNLARPITEPTPLKSFRELFIAHHPHWFIPRHQVWFSDNYPYGKLLLSRYDPERGSILAYSVTAARGHHTLEFWGNEGKVIVHSFNPRFSLDLEKPVVKLEVDSTRTDDQADNEPSHRGYAPPSLYSKETLMETADTSGVYSSLMLCHALPRTAMSEQTALWPPMHIPAYGRVRNESTDGYQSSGHRPSRFEELSQHNFRVRKWAEYHSRRAGPNVVNITSSHSSAAALAYREGPYFAAHLTSSTDGGMGFRMNEDITTFATIPKWMYTPTPQKPWQGIWCGDYSGHGCEFLVITQPDKNDERPLPQGMDWLGQWLCGGRRDSTSSTSSYSSAPEEMGYPGNTHDLTVANEVATAEDHIEPSTTLAKTVDLSFQQSAEEMMEYRDVPSGRLEAIKLTGDPNIPRGHYSFIAPDIGDEGLIKVADDAIFRGARIVKSAGHIAGRGFKEDQYTPTQLIMMSHDRIAQFWEGFGHISYYQRVDLDALMGFGVTGP